MPDEIDNLEAYDTWDWAAAEKRRGIPPSAVTVSIRLATVDFEAIAEGAARRGMTVTDLIRTAALDAAGEKRRPGARAARGDGRDRQSSLSCVSASRKLMRSPVDAASTDSIFSVASTSSTSSR